MKKFRAQPQHTRAEFGSVNREKRTVDIVWTTGAAVLRSSWYDGPFFEELSLDPAHVRMGRLTSGNAPFLMDHNGGRVAATAGVIESARLEKGQGVATVRFIKEGVDPEADKLFEKIADKVVRNVSVGYRTYKVQKTEGVEQKIPTLRAIDWEPYEVSAVAMGADAGASFRSAEQEENEVEVITRGLDPIPPERTKMDPEEIKRQEEAKRAAELAQQESIRAATEKAQREERERLVGIRSAARAAGLDEKFVSEMIDSGKSLSEVRAAALDALEKRVESVPTNAPRITGGADASEKFMRGAVSALLMATNASLVRQAKAANVEGFDTVDTGPNEMRGFSLSDFAREMLERQGVSTRGLTRSRMAELAFTTRSPYSGTADFPVLLENVLGKILLGAYAVTPDTWSAICKVESVSDFRASPRYRTGSLSVLDSLAENGEFKNKSIPDGMKMSISTATKGNMVGISRQLLINDDMSALSDLMAKLGRAAKLSIEVDFYALLAQNAGLGPTITIGSTTQPFFNAAWGNVNATGSALTVAGLDADRVVMGSQKDISNNEYLDLRPSRLLIPLGLGGQARVLNSSQYDPDATNKLQMPNKVAGLFQLIVDTPRLSGTRRYAFADPNIVPSFIVAFLNGQQAPTLEAKDGWRVDGTEMKVRTDYLVQAFDPKGAVTNAGA